MSSRQTPGCGGQQDGPQFCRVRHLSHRVYPTSPHLHATWPHPDATSTPHQNRLMHCIGVCSALHRHGAWVPSELSARANNLAHLSGGTRPHPGSNPWLDGYPNSAAHAARGRARRTRTLAALGFMYLFRSRASSGCSRIGRQPPFHVRRFSLCLSGTALKRLHCAPESVPNLLQNTRADRNAIHVRIGDGPAER